MAQFIDPKPKDLEEGEEFANIEDEAVIEESAEQLEESPVQEQAQTVEDEIPDKYQGKDIKDIVRMHQEAEKLLGRQSSEVGELRKIVDDFVKSQIEKAASPQKEQVEEIDFFSDPDKYLDNKLANHPKIKEAENVSRSMQQAEALNTLAHRHPDYQNIIQDEKFVEWITKSKVRMELYQRADQQFDFDAADELLTSWKERQNIVTETEQMQKEDRKRQLKSASTGSAKGSGEKSSRKIYRRADIIKLMQTDPDRYQELAPEIRQAYAEGRVR
jgi:hypothetical protein